MPGGQNFTVPGFLGIILIRHVRKARISSRVCMPSMYTREFASFCTLGMALMIAGWGGYPLIGTPAQIVEQLTALAKTGLDGIVLSWVNYRDEMRQWIDEVMPLIEQAGLRKPYRPQTE
jgi:hypothetical protein